LITKDRKGRFSKNEPENILKAKAVPKTGRIPKKQDKMPVAVDA